MNTIGFDRQKYIALQSQHIKERRAQFGGRLYLEMGENSSTICTHRVFFPVSPRTIKSSCWSR